ncbi:hypothetical protein Tco_1029513 [Tanacetum coccineum]|uniref:CCHC-type domain-containing protein n=1 Tax=Tanacetum coccineum TaxID=301880 RepID=A0ABQ5G5F2_9ASTR
MAKASPTQAWLWHRRLSHLNFDYINLLSKKDVVIGLPKLKYVKDQLCSSCEVSKAKRSSFKSKTVPSSKGRLNLLHMDLCGPMRVASINGKKHILVQRVEKEAKTVRGTVYPRWQVRGGRASNQSMTRVILCVSVRERASATRAGAAKLVPILPEPSDFFNYFYDDDDEESSIPLRYIISKLPPSIAITPILPTLEPEDSLIMGNEELSTIPKKESDEVIKSSVEDFVFSSPNDDESLSDEDILEDNFREIECKDSYDSHLDESTFLVTPLSDSNEDECITPSDDVELLLQRDSSTPMISVVSILEGFIDEPPLEENDDLFDLESKENEWKKILYDAPIDDLMTEDKVQRVENEAKTIMPPRKAPRTRTTPATTTNTTSVTNAQLQAMIDQGVAAALATRDANRSTNGEDNHNSGTGVRRTERVARECTYQDFMKCQPLFFKGTEGVVKLTQWFERMETVFRISNCTVENQIKFSTCTLLGVALMWWNSHVRTVGHDVAYAMTWTDLKKKMTDKYCPRSEIKKLEVELWNLKVKDDDAIEMATELMDKKISTLAERQAENKRKLDNNNQAQQQSPKRQNVAQAYAAGTGERKEYAGTLPLCNRCKLHHNGPCTVKCGNCKKIGHMTWDCRNPTAARNQRTLTCYECGNPGHYRSDCPELKNQNHGNQAEGTRARGLVHALGGGEADQDLNDMEDDISA